MRILAIDMGWSKSVSCLLDTGAAAKPQYQALPTGREAFAALLEQRKADVVVIEAGPMAGWVKDLCEQMGQKLRVLNTNDEPWQWRNVKKKTDRKDALKMTKIVAAGEGQDVHVPQKSVRQWRQLIHYRETLVNETVSVKNRLRAVLLQEDLRLPAGAKAWEGEEYQKLAALAREPKDCGPEELWKGVVHTELKRLDELERHLGVVESKLDAIAAADERVRKLKDQVPGVGVRTAEMVVATIDQPERFGRGRDVGCYAGLTPRKYQSGKMDRDGHISRAGCGLLRKYLVQAAWAGKRCDLRMAGIYERVRRKSPKRNKQAIVAVARHLLIWLWAMLRDGSDWQSPAVAASR